MNVDTPRRSFEDMPSINATAVNTPAGPSRAGSLSVKDIEKGDTSPAPTAKADKVDGEVHVRPAKTKHMTEADKVEYLNHQVEHGEQKFHKLGWVQLVVILIVEAIALGSLSLPAAFATLGMVPGVLITVGIGMLAIYTSYVIGQVKIKFPQVKHYDDVGPLLGGPGLLGKVFRGLLAFGFVAYLICLVGSHCLTGTIAFQTITKVDVCAIIWSVVSMVLLFLCALPPSFAEMAVLGYIDFVSIIAAILITLIATGIKANNQVGSFAAVDWSAWPKEGTTFSHAMVAVSNVVFAYSFAICQFSFMEEMHTPKDFKKSVWVLGITEIVIYTCTGALGYAFIGKGVKAPALLSAGDTVSRIAFGVAIPVIIISGSINTVTAGRFTLDKFFSNSTIRYVSDARGWAVWVGWAVIASIVAWIIAEAIPFFSDLLAIISALFISGFSFYVPGFMWFKLVKEGKWHQGWRNIVLSVLNTVCIVIGVICLVCGTYGAVEDIKLSYELGTVGTPFSCNKS
ncbi:hypothetical protein CcaverHIS002_0601420 [Cutaneotrichosporon cavernicola]|uniref:Amino acid transporter transmembrane domain-containing protein n=1 Tax=Cutaneotrichosporon cavernicola TaxID=279322 RepID=A0AA48QWM4_9TREE|nr:uncharacterized protein CcaverHIS019_0501510 [Cutaneotrichosporon cavernicola]BEI85855.1 hypothetical protein CcaverHIS002_0601420 [Cutaneotrichosporon cavernicola]BEI92523.1 hypothetical protein CcaverHIS019_0501510 [Cutaneotrichosporon cavernicola]BEJ00296.1 hypothetical protein CcaverHIS631_0501530 [Cutaneotrichosporon cavernicola]BEJ08066.1 hypothetical protein CcaverHIS641_0501510 [Cutaneotrichosporon cavernicola]